MLVASSTFITASPHCRVGMQVIMALWEPIMTAIARTLVCTWTGDNVGPPTPLPNSLAYPCRDVCTSHPLVVLFEPPIVAGLTLSS